MLTPQQLEQRLNFLTGSDVGAILGINEYKTPVQVWLEKTRQLVAEDISDKPAVKAGIRLEDAVATWFEHETGKQVIKDDKFFIHSNLPYLGGNIDRLVVGENALLECKTTQSDRGWGAGFIHGDNKIPDNYLCQVIHYCAITGCEVGYVAVLIRGIDFRWYKYERDLSLEATIIERLTQFWFNHVQSNVAPEPKTADEVKTLLRGNVSDDYVMINDIGIIGALEMLRHTREELKRLKEVEEACKNEICVYMGDKQTLVNTDGTIAVTWNQREGSTRFDSKSFKEKHPDLYKQFEVKGDYVRTFLVK
jgi:putative phage-type endonuclease